MNKDQKHIAEKIIDKMKNSNNGLTSLMQINMIVDNQILCTSIIESLVSDFKLIEKLGNDFRLTSKGYEFISFAELENEISDLKERNRIEFEKSKLDLKLAEQILEEYPKTKWFARIGFVIAILLSLKELYILVYK